MMKLAVLPVAIAGVLASNAAFAGSEGCFEIVTQPAGAPVTDLDLETSYQPSSCVDIVAPSPAKIAYELTQNLPLDLGSVDTAGLKKTQIVYIPTTDIPGGTVIRMELSLDAVFQGNAGQIHLMKQDPVTHLLSTVASTDGAVDGQREIQFITKAGTTIGAGTRLVLTKDSTTVDPIGIKVAHSGCTSDTSTAKVTITATSAITDGEKGYLVKGGVSKAVDLLDLSTQFVTYRGVDTSKGVTPTVGEVNAESTNNNGESIVARTEFVYDAKAANPTLELQQYQIVTPVSFVDRGPTLDRAVALGANDRLVQKFWAAKAVPTDNVKLGIYSTVTPTTNVLDDLVDVDNTIANNFADFDADVSTAYAYKTLASDVFTAGNTKTLYYALENTDHNAIMNYNYSANVDGVLDFENAGYLDHCSKSTLTHDINVNGAVLKVPYSFDSSNTWVRITNESSEAADITMDIFDESGHEANSIVVGSVGKKASVVLLASDLVAKAKAAGLTTDGKGRYTMTFVVTAPKNTVHGVSVQKIPGGVDRVVPVLDQNDWKM